MVLQLTEDGKVLVSLETISHGKIVRYVGVATLETYQNGSEQSAETGAGNAADLLLLPSNVLRIN